MKKCLKSILSLILISLSLIAYSDENLEDYTSLYDTLDKHQKEFLTTLEEHFSWRKSAIDFYHEVQGSGPIMANKSTRMRNGIIQYLNLREKTFKKYVEQNKNITHAATELKLTSGKTEIETQSNMIWLTNRLVKINPFDFRGEEYIREIKEALLAALIMYENYTLVGSVFFTDKRLSQLINYNQEDNDGRNLDWALQRVAKSATNFKNINTLYRGIKFLEKVKNKVRKYSFPKFNKYHQYLNKMLDLTPSYKTIKKTTYVEMTKERLKVRFESMKDQLNRTANVGMNELSKVMGNTLGMVETRKGKLYRMEKKDPKRFKALIGKLEPLDLLLEKTPFRLTDKFIPGHWGHVAIWTGNVSQIENLMLELNFNFQERYIVEKYLVDVELGHKIVEALRPGVQINTMEHFLNIDDLAVMRFEDLSDSQKKRFLINTFKQIGKEYDFNFDVDTQDKIVCSEIAYIAFDDIEWETEKKVGRFTISPDNVANKIKSKQYNISIPVLIHKGKDIKRDIEQNFLRLLEGDYESITF